MPTLKIASQAANLSNADTAAVRNWIIEQFMAQQHAKLEQGGHTGQQIPLRAVFIDLPVGTRPNGMPEAERENFLSNVLRTNPGRLREFIEESPNSRSRHNLEDDLKYVSTVLIGGPGQGKSTLTQLASQIHRAVLLKPHMDELTWSQRENLQAFFSFMSEDPDELAEPETALLPIQVSLPELSAWLAKHPNPTGDIPQIVGFLASLPSATSLELRPVTLDKLLRVMPALLIFDGFDEVGASADRRLLVQAIRELIVSLARSDGIAQIIATTRPQGYAGELSNTGIPMVEHYLAPLTKSEAIIYAKKLIHAKAPGLDEEARLMERLNEASRDDSTARLLTTPLQVTILAALLQQIGRAPRERWNLFNLYFTYTYNREIERNTYASPLLAKYRAQIEQIHASVGLILQIEAEKVGGASAKMTRDHLLDVINQILGEDEFDPEEQQILAHEIASAAETRLVFLVEPVPNYFGFEIRSLQEFMAARAITHGREGDVETRIRAIAGSSIFRNVFLFIASKLYSEGSILRDLVADQICNELDTKSVPHEQCRAGATLALEILEEGAVLAQPKRARALMSRAIGVLALPLESLHLRLGSVVTSDTQEIFFSAIEKLLIGNDPRVYLPGWISLLERIERGDKRAESLASQRWEIGPRAEIIAEKAFSSGVAVSEWLLQKIEESSFYINPRIIAGAQSRSQYPSTLNWAAWLTNLFRNREWGNRSVLRASLVKSKKDAIPEPLHPAPKAWVPFITYSKFEQSPTLENYTRALVALAQEWSDEKSHGWYHSKPTLDWRCSWPIRAAIMAAIDKDDLLNFAQLAKSGVLGNVKNWLRLQKEWDSVPTALLHKSAELVMPQTPYGITAWSPPQSSACPTA